MTESFRVNEGTRRINEANYQRGKIDQSKLNKLKSTAKKYGYNLVDLRIEVYVGELHVSIKIDRVDSLPLRPHIRDERVKDKLIFSVSPAFMGELDTKDARKMAKFIEDAADFVDLLNKINWEDYVSEWEEH